METTNQHRGSLRDFKGIFVWSGILFALGGYLAEEFTGGKHGFEFFMLFGGLYLGIGVERNRSQRLHDAAKDPESPTLE